MQYLTMANNDHTLMAGAVFVHPVNGNVYFCSNEKVSPSEQNLVIYRLTMQNEKTVIKRYIGGIDSLAQITYGSAVIRPDGSMVVAMSLIPPNSPTKSGFAPMYDIIPNVDAPYNFSTVNGTGSLPTFDMLPNGGKPYISNADVGVVGQRDDLYYVRMNKSTAVLKQVMIVVQQLLEKLR